MVTLAKRVFTIDVVLRKIYQIKNTMFPIPPMGHWQKNPRKKPLKFHSQKEDKEEKLQLTFQDSKLI
jgi:hypothetical protein